jgi:O-antigen ligase
MAVLTRSTPARRSRRSTIITVVVCFALAALVGLVTVKLGSLQHQLKALIIVMAGAAMVVAALRPDFGLILLMALIPFELQFYGTGSDQVLLLSLALVMMWRVRVREIPAWVSIGGVALVAGSFIASVGAHNQSIAFEGAVNWLAAILVLFVALTVLGKRRNASRRMVDIFTGSAMIVVLFAFLQRAGIYAIVGAPFTAGHPSSFFGYYTAYAGYVAMAATFATGEILIALNERQIARVSIYGVVLVICLVGLTVSTSRGGIVSLACGWLLLLVLNVRRGPILAQAVIALAVFAGAGYIATPASTVATIEHRIALSNGGQAEDKERFALHKAGEEALSTYPLGLGYGNFSYYLDSHQRTSKITQSFFHAHETPVQIGLDTGWLGLAGFLMLFAWPIVLVLRNRSKGIDVVRASVFAAALAGLMAQGLYDYLFYELDYLVFFVAMVWGATHSLSIDQQLSRGAGVEVPTFGAGPPIGAGADA